VQAAGFQSKTLSFHETSFFKPKLRVFQPKIHVFQPNLSIFQNLYNLVKVERSFVQENGNGLARDRRNLLFAQRCFLDIKSPKTCTSAKKLILLQFSNFSPIQYFGKVKNLQSCFKEGKLQNTRNHIIERF
jgi:hypothetical protein